VFLIRGAFAVVLAIVAASSASAHTTSGRFTTSLYTFERADSTDLRSTHTRAYQVVQLSHVRGDFGLHLYGQVDGDFTTKLVDDPKVRTYGLYFDWKNLGSIVDLRIGRQPLFAGVATSTVDGGKIRLNATQWVWLEAFGGLLIPPDQDTRIIDDPDRNYLYGGQLVFLPTSESRIGFSYFDKRQERPGFETVRADSIGDLFTQFIEPSELTYELGSLDASWFLPRRSSLLGRLDYDFYRQRLTRGEIGGRSQVAASLSFRAAYVYRTPRIPASSIFGIFEAEENQEVDLSLDYRLASSLRLYGGGATVLYSDDESYRGTLGIGNSFADVNYVHRGGYAGDLDGVNAWLRHALLGGRLAPSAQLSWARYGPDSGGGDRETLFAGTAGLNLRPRRSLSLDLEVQYLHNPRYADDLRFLTRFQYWFFKRGGERSP
jgi:hypothetical protein